MGGSAFAARSGGRPDGVRRRGAVGAPPSENGNGEHRGAEGAGGSRTRLSRVASGEKGKRPKRATKTYRRLSWRPPFRSAARSPAGRPSRPQCPIPSASVRPRLRRPAGPVPRAPRPGPAGPVRWARSTLGPSSRPGPGRVRPTGHPPGRVRGRPHGGPSMVLARHQSGWHQSSFAPTGEFRMSSFSPISRPLLTGRVPGERSNSHPRFPPSCSHVVA